MPELDNGLIPIAAARDFAIEHKLTQVIIVGWNGRDTHVVTYGASATDCDQAAMGGNLVKKAIGFPESMCGSKPSRVRELEAKILQQEATIDELERMLSEATH